MAMQIARIKNTRLYVDTEAIGNVLDKVGAHPVAVIAINGPLNRGKSTIINRLLSLQTSPKENVEDSFHQIEMVERLWKYAPDQPNEILMWPEPLMMTHNGRSTAVLIMSVHGNLDNSVTTMDNALIVTFGCLLASVTIYHVQNGFSDDKLQFLQMIIASARAVSHQEDCCPFAKLLFVINNWQSPADYNYGYHEDHSPSSTKNFKKDSLNVPPERMPENRVVRQEILSSFEEVCCCLAPYFGDEKVEDNGPLQALGNWIYRDGCSISKKLRGRAVTATELKGLVQEWAGSLTTSKIPAFRTEHEGPYEVADAMALSVAFKFFQVEITSAIHKPKRLRNEQLVQVHARKKQEAVAMFRRLVPTRHPVVLQLYEDMLQAEEDDSLGTFLQMNDQRGQIRQPTGRGPVQYRIEDPAIAERRRKNRTGCKICCLVIILLKIIGTSIYYFVMRPSIMH